MEDLCCDAGMGIASLWYGLSRNGDIVHPYVRGPKQAAVGRDVIALFQDNNIPRYQGFCRELMDLHRDRCRDCNIAAVPPGSYVWIVTSFTLAFSLLGIVICSTPSLSSAFALSACTIAGSVMVREKAP